MGRENPECGCMNGVTFQVVARSLHLPNVKTIYLPFQIVARPFSVPALKHQKAKRTLLSPQCYLQSV